MSEQPPAEQYSEENQYYSDQQYDYSDQGQYDYSGYQQESTSYDNYYGYDQQQTSQYYGDRNEEQSYGGSDRGRSYREDRSYHREEPKDGVQKIQDTIYINNLPEDVTEEKLATHFGSIGILKTDRKTRKPKIWIYYDKSTGKPKGDATLTYDDPPSADAAIEWFSGKEFMGKVIQVTKAERKLPTTSFGSSGGRSNSGRTGGRGGGYRDRGSRGGGTNGSNFTPTNEGDWMCKSCGSNNFARRIECFKCRTRPESTRGSSERGNGHDDRGGGRKRRDDYSRHVGGGRDDNSYRKDRHERRDRPY
ncbi:uncharacterized protein BX664DRAFT_340555 [Halteromyces radiatus]|uniref:uncharacterized protein n=1 Tax=Halteromyces radiatus TaxID=101107 RepID=UPI00221F9040|nr:uncharacterized protein BX664DRAFT_340555 [Halteromyces radiatus]KAI8081504.1 hypothetical protein BX664DRAFT_340555 [Halteromyces radiatus]